jgi:hypothetical protein
LVVKLVGFVLIRTDNDDLEAEKQTYQIHVLFIEQIPGYYTGIHKTACLIWRLDEAGKN